MTLPGRRNMTGLTPWPKGTSGNPSGKRKGSVSLVARLKKALRKKPQGQGSSYADRIVLRVVRDADAGDKDAIALVFKYAVGLPLPQLPEGSSTGIMFVVTAPPGVDEPDIIDVVPKHIEPAQGDISPDSNGGTET